MEATTFSKALFEQHGIAFLADGASWGTDAAAAARTRARLSAQLQADPLIDIYRAAIRTESPVTALLALAMQRAYAALIAGRSPLRIEVMQQPEDVQRIVLASELTVAQTYLWTDRVFETLNAYPLPPHVVDPSILPFVATFHAYEHAATIADHDGAARFIPFELWTGRGGGASLTRLIIQDGAAPFAKGSFIDYGRRYPDDFGDQAPAVGQTLAMCAFVKSPFVVVNDERLPRQLRRHGGTTPRDVERTIAVVTMRQAARDALAAYDAESRTFRHRWWVRGHYRRQWRPSRRAHEVIWIAPFLKGRPDAPMLPTVYRVSR